MARRAASTGDAGVSTPNEYPELQTFRWHDPRTGDAKVSFGFEVVQERTAGARGLGARMYGLSDVKEVLEREFGREQIFMNETWPTLRNGLGSQSYRIRYNNEAATIEFEETGHGVRVTTAKFPDKLELRGSDLISIAKRVLERVRVVLTADFDLLRRQQAGDYGGAASIVRGKDGREQERADAHA